MARNELARLMTENRKLMEQVNTLSDALALMQQWFGQLVIDLMTIVLADKDVMGRDTFGTKRLERIYNAMTELYNEYHEAIVNRVESDYKRADIDRRLRQICGDKAVPWEERYEGWRIDE